MDTTLPLPPCIHGLADHHNEELRTMAELKICALHEDLSDVVSGTSTVITDPGVAIERRLADLGLDRSNTLIARWQAGLGDLTLASYDAIVAACEWRLAPDGVALVTTGLVWEAEGEQTQLLLVTRVA